MREECEKGSISALHDGGRCAIISPVREVVGYVCTCTSASRLSFIVKLYRVVRLRGHYMMSH